MDDDTNMDRIIYDVRSFIRSDGFCFSCYIKVVLLWLTITAYSRDDVQTINNCVCV